MAKKIQPSTPTKTDREHMIAEAAYYLAEQRHFIGGDPEQDWYEAASNIDAFLDKHESGRK